MSADETDSHDSQQSSRNGSEELVARWLHFRENYQALGYRKASYEYFSMWALEQFGDLPSRDPEVLRKIVRAYQKRIARRSQGSNEA